jgi:hypothetical protein
MVKSCRAPTARRSDADQHERRCLWSARGSRWGRSVGFRSNHRPDRRPVSSAPTSSLDSLDEIGFALCTPAAADNLGIVNFLIPSSLFNVSAKYLFSFYILWNCKLAVRCRLFTYSLVRRVSEWNHCFWRIKMMLLPLSRFDWCWEFVLLSQIPVPKRLSFRDRGGMYLEYF